jgi:ureidoacrylate peracid hydrolase
MSLKELLDPASTALMLIDVQNDFCHAEGATARSGKSVQAALDMLAPLQRLLAQARAGGVHVIFVQMLQMPWTLTKTYVFRGGDEERVEECTAGTWGAEFCGVAPLEREPVVTKHRYSAFVGTSLEPILHALGVRTLVMTGVATNVCVESTARDAFMRDYDVVVVSDCTATSSRTAHEGTLDNIRAYFGQVASSDEIIGVWSPHLSAAVAAPPR